jgi:hypothetical protein
MAASGRWPRWTGGSTFILKIAVTATNTPTADELCQRGIDLLAAWSAVEAAEAFRGAIGLDAGNVEAHHGLVRALRDAGRLEQAVGAALALTALTPGDPLAHTALSITLQHAGHVPEAETAAARARVLEWKIQLQSPPDGDPTEDNQPHKDPPAEAPPVHDPSAHDPPEQDPPSKDPPVKEPPAGDPKP